MLGDLENSKMRSTDRILQLRPKEGMKAKGTTGLIDPRVFTGENKLHCVMNEQNCLWFFRYDFGILPAPLRDVFFTSFTAAKKHAETYFKSRNVELTEVID